MRGHRSSCFHDRALDAAQNKRVDLDKVSHSRARQDGRCHHVIPIAGSDPTSLCFVCFGLVVVVFFVCFVSFVFGCGFLVSCWDSSLDCVQVHPLPVLLWLSTSRQPYMIITIHLFAAIERV